jgi:hypothetical protein
VQTAAGTDDFDVVVNAAGAWCDRVGAVAGARPIGLVPRRRTAFTFAPSTAPGPYPWPMVIDVDERFYFRPEGIHVLGSPCDETPLEPQDIRHEEIDVALGIARIAAVTTLTFAPWCGLGGIALVRGGSPVRSTAGIPNPRLLLAGRPGGLASRPRRHGRFCPAMILEGAPRRIWECGNHCG